MAGFLAIASNFIAFIATIYFNKQANTISKLFPIKTGEVSHRNQTEVTPATSTFVIWAFIYLLQASWIIYSLTFLFRSGESVNILPTYFFICYSISCVFNISWLISWAHEKFAICLALIVSIMLSLQICLSIAYHSLQEYLMNVPEALQSQTDIWCIRILVLNGIMLYAAWVTIATCINLAIYLQTSLHVRKSKAGTVALTALLVIVLLWFSLENFVFYEHTRYTFTEYIVLLVALNGILRKQWTDGRGNQSFVMAIFVISGMMFVARLMIIMMKERYI